jgi:hypothetical protein
MILRLKEAVELTELASKVYARLDPQEYVGKLAPSLGLVMQKDLSLAEVAVSSEFSEPIIFLSTTHFREAMVEALRTVNAALQGLGGAAVLSLTHAMGLGKTHFLTFLYHLYVNAPRVWSEVESQLPDAYDVLTEKANYRVDVAKRTLVVPIDLKFTPPNLKPYEALAVLTREVLERKRAFLEGESSKGKIDELSKMLSELSKYEPKDAAKRLCEALARLGVIVPVLIIIDELYASVAEAMMGASGEYVDSLRKALIFMSALVDELQGKEPVALVYASAQQDVERWSELKGLGGEGKVAMLREAVKFFEDRMQRYSVRGVGDVSEDEALSIVKKRTLKFKAPLGEVLSEERLVKLRSLIAEIVGEGEAGRFVRELKETYPFSPVYKELVRKIVVPTYSRELSNVQHLRDLIKISSTVLGRAIDDKDSYLVSIAHVEHEDVKHVLDPRCAREWERNVMTWRRHVDERARDPNEARMLKGATHAVYVKSITDNIMDLIQMLSMKPDALPRDAIERRALHQRSLLLSLVGFVGLSELGKYRKVVDGLEEAPFIYAIDRSDGRYFIASLFSNPLQLISNKREEELERLRDERGELKPDKALDYVESVLQEYELVSRLKERAPLDFEPVDVGVFDDDAFLDYLKRDTFTVLTVSPISVARRSFIEGVSFDDVLEKVKSTLERNTNKMKYLNMFAVVVPCVGKGDLEKLVKSLAEIKASEAVLEMYKRPEVLDSTVRYEVEKRKTLMDILRKLERPEEELRRIVAETIMTFRDKLEKFAQQLTNAAVQNFTSDLVGTFERIITYDPVKGSIEGQRIELRAEGQVESLRKVVASLPVWIVNTVRGKLSVASPESIRAALEAWVGAIVSKSEHVREELMRSGAYRYKINTIKDGLARGWPDVPIKPQSLQAVQLALKSFEGGCTISLEDERLKLIEIVVEGEDLIIKRAERPQPPPPSPPKPIVRGFKVLGVDRALMLLYALESSKWLADNAEKLHVELLLEPRDAGRTEISARGPKAKLLDLVKPLATYLNKHRNEVAFCVVEAWLGGEVEEKEALPELEKIGLRCELIR